MGVCVLVGMGGGYAVGGAIVADVLEFADGEEERFDVAAPVVLAQRHWIKNKNFKSNNLLLFRGLMNTLKSQFLIKKC